MARTWTLNVILLLVALIAKTAWAAPSEQVLYSFGSDRYPGGVIFDSHGNLYGVCSAGGQYGYGSVFELSPSSNGWTETVLYSFTGGLDGGSPGETQSLVFDNSGNLYGTTVRGGTTGYGTAFKLTPSIGGNWAETVIHSFLDLPGGYPEVGLVFDAAGNLYGTTSADNGTIFEMSPQLSGGWKYRILHMFQYRSTEDGSGPLAALTFDAAGNLYGTTYIGGTLNCGYGQNGCGTVFKLTSTSGGGWHYRQIYRFQGASDGERPYGSVVITAAGDVYGTTNLGGNGQCYSNVPGCGTVFELSPSSDDSYAHSVIYTFAGTPTDGGSPQGGLVLDPAGNLFGTTFQGGTINGGTAFGLAPDSSGWQETVLHSFGHGTDGQEPSAEPIMDSSGNIYGTTYTGGVNGLGAVFELTP